MNSKILGLVAAGLLSAAVGADAAPLTMNFSGTNGGGAFGISGASVAGSFTFETSTVAGSSSCISATDLDCFTYTDPVTAMSGSVSWSGGSFTFGASGGNIFVNNNGCAGGICNNQGLIDQFNVNPTNANLDGLSSTSGHALNAILLALIQAGPNNNPPTCNTSAALPQSAAYFACYPSGNGFLKMVFDGGVLTWTNVSITPKATPEPGTLALLGLGLAGLGLSRRRKA